MLTAVAAVDLGLFVALTPLLVIYGNGALIGGVGGALYARKNDIARSTQLPPARALLAGPAPAPTRPMRNV